MALKDGSPEDYKSAAIRHFQDACSLKELGQLDNSGHLIGFAAECAIKHQINISTQASVNLHLPELLAAARKHLGTRSNFVGLYNIIKNDVLPGWSIDHRYAPTGKVNKETLEDWHHTAKRLLAAAGIKSRPQ